MSWASVWHSTWVPNSTYVPMRSCFFAFLITWWTSTMCVRGPHSSDSFRFRGLTRTWRMSSAGMDFTSVRQRTKHKLDKADKHKTAVWETCTCSGDSTSNGQEITTWPKVPAAWVSILVFTSSEPLRQYYGETAWVPCTYIHIIIIKTVKNSWSWLGDFVEAVNCDNEVSEISMWHRNIPGYIEGVRSWGQ